MDVGDQEKGPPPSPLRLPAFRRFLLAHLISAAGSAMAPVALAFAVIGQGGGAGSLGIVLNANTVPTVVFLLVGGVLADRMSRSRILFLGNLGAGTAQGAVAALVATGTATTAAISVCACLSGVSSAFTAPAAQGVASRLVPPEQLQQANALVRVPRNAVKVVGPVVGGFVVALTGPAWALGWDALTFVVAALLLSGLRLPGAVSPGGSGGLLADVREGWAGFKSRVWLWSYTLSGTAVVAAWLAGYQLLGPIVAARSYAGAGSWGLVQGAFAAGLLGGTFVCLLWKPRRLMLVCVVTSSGLMLPLAALGLGLSLPWVLLATAVAGVGMDVAIVAWSTVLQQQVPDQELGRLSSLNSLGEQIAIPVGYLLVAVTSAYWGSGRILLVCSAVILVAGVANACVRDVYRIRRV
ncbi:putative MFS family arabinose efflux permease [Streptomyces sp. KhCrAH-43]|uniref:MFS transporter n=1 Tax=unclassified Streptomyces TaxID=2593676 RepID=UPI000DC2FB12|nr:MULTISPECIES: MFS transporter [unclassified Streptomyces]RAJ64820.1 putative MFS family arabinose efflux permease [Streptomyces sp. KhCrAH-43]